MAETISTPASTSTPLARGPITFAGERINQGGWEVTARRSLAPLSLVDLAPLSKLTVRAPVEGAMRAALGVSFGRAARSGGLGGALVIGSGPGEWLVLGPPDRGVQLHGELERVAGKSGEFVSVVDLTHGRALVRLHGERSYAVLAKLCAIDLSDRVTPNGAAFRSSVARVTTDVVRDDRDGVRSYLLHCERSSGQYLADCLLDAGGEFGIDVEGFNPPGI